MMWTCVIVIGELIDDNITVIMSMFISKTSQRINNIMLLAVLSDKIFTSNDQYKFK